MNNLPIGTGETGDPRIITQGPAGTFILAPQERSKSLDDANARKIDKETNQKDFLFTFLKFFIGLVVGLIIGFFIGKI